MRIRLEVVNILNFGSNQSKTWSSFLSSLVEWAQNSNSNYNYQMLTGLGGSLVRLIGLYGSTQRIWGLPLKFINKRPMISSDAASNWAGRALAHPDFGSSVNPIPTRVADYAHHIIAYTPWIENQMIKSKKKKIISLIWFQPKWQWSLHIGPCNFRYWCRKLG